MQLVLAITLALVASANARSNGAPADACNDQVPGHYPNTPSTDESPYSVFYDDDDDTYTYDHPKTIRVLGSSDIKGVLCQARKVSDLSIILGQMQVSDEKLQTLTCTDEANSVTHANNNPVESVSFEWWPPMGDMGDIIIRCTVVQSFTEFWTEQDSGPMSFNEGSAEPSPEPSSEPEPSGEPEWDDDHDDDDAPMPPSGASRVAVSGFLVSVLLSLLM